MLSLLQARQLYKLNFQHIESLAMQEGLNDQEFPSDPWLVKALSVGYAIFLNASKQKIVHQPQLLAKPLPKKDETSFLFSILFNTIKLFGVSQFLQLIWILLKNITSLISILNNVLFVWKGAPPTPEDLESILITPLGGDLSKEFREQGSIGIRIAFANFFDIQTTTQLKALKEAQRRSLLRLSESEVQSENQKAIADSRAEFSEYPACFHFKSLQAFRDLFVTLPLPAIADTFEDDEVFAYLRLAGPNPLMLERVTAESPLFKKFPVSESQFQSVMGEHDSMQRAGLEGRLFAVDYEMLHGAVLGTFGATREQQKYLYPAISLFAVPDQSQSERYLQTIAIQCGQNPHQYPILTRHNAGKYAWLAAKSAIQVADATIHEAISHLAYTHLLVEPFVVCTHRQLPEIHCVFKLLHPHFEGTILINFGAWKLLTAPGQAVDSLLPPTIDQSRTLAVLGLRQRGFNDQMLPKRLEEQGLMDLEALPLYPYRDDGLAVWSALHDWVSAYIRLHYPSDQSVVDDVALQNWSQELIDIDGGRVEQFGDDGTGVIMTVDYLIDALTMIIFTGSVQHAAVNFPQKDIMSFAPAMPMAGYVPGSVIPMIQSEEDWCNMLPPEDQAKQQLQVLHVLGGVNYTQLGDYRVSERESFGSDAAQALCLFHKRLKEIEQDINDRNNQLPQKFEYSYLKPSLIPQSINI